MTFFESELMKMFGKNRALSDIRCTGNALIGRLTSDTVAKISFITGDVRSQYTSALIRVINSHKGEVDRQVINFCDAFGCSRKDYIHIWEPSNEEPHWYMFKPSQQNYEAINLAAQQYLELFLEPVQGMNMSM